MSVSYKCCDRIDTYIHIYIIIYIYFILYIQYRYHDWRLRTLSDKIRQDLTREAGESEPGTWNMQS